MKNNRRRIKYLGSPIQKKLLFLIFASAVIPATIIAVAMYYVIFNLMAWQMVIPEAIAYNIMPVLRKVNTIIAIAMPLVLLAIWFTALEVSHRIAGPLYRLEKELDSLIAGTSRGPIKLRKHDEFKLLAEKINKMLFK